jgi:cbb3-type cytochrome oxidase maturation protein
MTLLTIAIPVALLVAVAAVLAFIWAARSDQFEDLDTPPRRMLLDDAPLPSAPLPSAHGRDRVPSTSPR